LWNVLVGSLGLVVYLLGMRRVVYPYEKASEDAGAGYVRAESGN
jgi:hypothetical protein